MNSAGRILTALAIAAVAFTAVTFIKGTDFDLLLLIAFCVATVASALVTSIPGPATPGEKPASDKQAPAKKSRSTTGGKRESGKVKWFNVSKGYGFITTDKGEEIFVHFRSIQGEGRRSLREGQPVTFVITKGEKGPQAEDVSTE